MYKNKTFIIVAILACIVLSSSKTDSVTPFMVIPQAVNTINSVNLSDLNLKHGSDYTIMDKTTAEASVIYSVKRKGEEITIKEENNEFIIVYKSDHDKWYIADYEGIARFGFLSNDYGTTHTDWLAPEYIVRNLAIYRLINASKVRGADGVIEPVISTNVEQRGKDIVFKTTVTAKLIKLSHDTK